MRSGKLAFVVAAAVTGLVSALVAVAPTAAASPAPKLRLVSVAAPPPLPRGAVRLGPVAGQSVLHLVVTLRVRKPAALAGFVAAVSDRQSPLFRHFLRPRQFGAMFGPTPSQVAAVRSALRSQGLSPGPVTANMLAIPVTGSASAIERALSTSLIRYQLPGGRVAYANASAPRLPAAAAPYVQGVIGLNDLYRQRSLIARPARPAIHRGAAIPGMALAPSAAGPRPCAAARRAAAANGSYTANQLASYYVMSPLYGAGDRGQGVHVALAEFEPNSATDIATYKSCYRIHTPVSYVPVDGGAGSGTGSGEAALDIEDVMGLAPGASIDVYQAPNGGDTNTYDLYSAIIDADADQVMSTSWGLCELDTSSSLITAEDTLFAQADAQGQTVFASAGDSGSTDCYGDGSGNGANLSVDDPASQPYVVGVGGTSIGTNSENVWNDSSISDGAGGGGLSAAWCMPSYQYRPAIPGLISGYSATAASCGTKVPYVRQVPDVAADADPYTGYTIYYRRSWQPIGGTSAAAPLWAAVAALTDASPFCHYYRSGDPGVLPEGLYFMASFDHSYIYPQSNLEVLYDVTRGNNHYTPSGYTGSLYPATGGYDMATGLGTPLVGGLNAAARPSMFYPGLAALMCWNYGTKLGKTTVTGLSPHLGPAGHARTIAITGSGFLPVAGADRAEVGRRYVNATCTSTTRCTARLPVMRPGTVSIRMLVEDLTLSRVTKVGHYTVVAAPSVSSLSPASGSARGGNKVTIRGSNFIGVISVRFGHKRAARIRVISSRQITVTAPPGSGRVRVTVTAVGGTSRSTRSSQYRYT